MALTNTDIKHIAKLSKLSLDDAQIERYGKELDAIVSYMDILNSVPKEQLDTQEVTDRLILPLDPDTVVDSPISRESLLANSAQKKVAGTIAVPNIMN